MGVGFELGLRFKMLEKRFVWGLSKNQTTPRENEVGDGGRMNKKLTAMKEACQVLDECEEEMNEIEKEEENNRLTLYEQMECCNAALKDLFFCKQKELEKTRQVVLELGRLASMVQHPCLRPALRLLTSRKLHQ